MDKQVKRASAIKLKPFEPGAPKVRNYAFRLRQVLAVRLEQAAQASQHSVAAEIERRLINSFEFDNLKVVLGELFDERGLPKRRTRRPARRSASEATRASA